MTHARTLSIGAGYFYLYLSTCKHTNMIGAFQLPNGYITADLGHNSETISQLFNELSQNGLVHRYENSDWGFLPHYLETNTLDNENMEKKALKVFEQIPSNELVKIYAAKTLNDTFRFVSTEKLKRFRNRFETVSKPFPEKNKTVPEPFSNPETTVSKHVDVDVDVTNPPKVPQTGDECVLDFENPGGEDTPSSPPPDTEATTPKAKRPKATAQTVERVFAYWQQVMKHPDAKLDDKRRKKITAAIALGYTQEQLFEAIDGCRVTPHNMGDNDHGRVYDDIELICRDAKHIDDFRRNKGSPPKSQRNSAVAAKIAEEVKNRPKFADCHLCQTQFEVTKETRDVEFKPTCAACYPDAYKLSEKRAYERECAKKGLVKNSSGQWVKPVGEWANTEAASRED